MMIHRTMTKCFIMSHGQGWRNKMSSQDISCIFCVNVWVSQLTFQAVVREQLSKLLALNFWTLPEGWDGWAVQIDSSPNWPPQVIPGIRVSCVGHHPHCLYWYKRPWSLFAQGTVRIMSSGCGVSDQVAGDASPWILSFYNQTCGGYGAITCNIM